MPNRDSCEFPIEDILKCPHKGKVKVTRPNPIDPQAYPKRFCFPHLTSFIRSQGGQFLVESLVPGKEKK